MFTLSMVEYECQCLVDVFVYFCLYHVTQSGKLGNKCFIFSSVHALYGQHSPGSICHGHAIERSDIF